MSSKKYQKFQVAEMFNFRAISAFLCQNDVNKTQKKVGDKQENYQIISIDGISQGYKLTCSVMPQLIKSARLHRSKEWSTNQ